MTGGRYLIVISAAALGGVAIGAASPRVNDTVMWLTPVLVLVALAIWATAARVARLQQHLGSSRTLGEQSTADGHSAAEDGSFGAARALFYLGTASVGWLQLRFGGVTASDALFLCSVLVAIATLAGSQSGALPRLPGTLAVGIALFAYGSSIATIEASADAAGSFAILARVLYLLTVWILLAGTVLRTSRHVLTAVGCWVFSAVVSAGWGVGQKYFGFSGITEGAGARVQGLTDHVNDLGSLCAIVVVPAIALVFLARRRSEKLIASTAVLIILAGLMVSGSIGATLAAGCGLLAATIARDLARAVIVGALAVALLIPVAGIGGVGTPLERFERATTAGAPNRQGTLQTRIEVLGDALDHLRREPLIGVGLDAESSQIFSYYSGKSHNVHNLIVGRWYESGLLGMVGIVMILYALFRVSWTTVVNAASRTGQLLAVALFASLVSMAAVGMSEPLLYKRYGLMPVALAFALLWTRTLNSEAATTEPSHRFSTPREELSTRPVVRYDVRGGQL